MNESTIIFTINVKWLYDILSILKTFISVKSNITHQRCIKLYISNNNSITMQAEGNGIFFEHTFSSYEIGDNMEDLDNQGIAIDTMLLYNLSKTISKSEDLTFSYEINKQYINIKSNKNHTRLPITLLSNPVNKIKYHTCINNINLKELLCAMKQVTIASNDKDGSSMMFHIIKSGIRLVHINRTHVCVSGLINIKHKHADRYACISADTSPIIIKILSSMGDNDHVNLMIGDHGYLIDCNNTKIYLKQKQIRSIPYQQYFIDRLNNYSNITLDTQEFLKAIKQVLSIRDIQDTIKLLPKDNKLYVHYYTPRSGGTFSEVELSAVNGVLTKAIRVNGVILMKSLAALKGKSIDLHYKFINDRVMPMVLSTKDENYAMHVIPPVIL